MQKLYLSEQIYYVNQSLPEAQAEGSDFINTFFGTHNFLRATVSEHPRDDVFYYYTLVNLLVLFPWSGLVMVAAYRWYKNGHQALAEQQKFLLLWVVVVFGFFQCMATKYITYTYPCSCSL